MCCPSPYPVFPDVEINLNDPEAQNEHERELIEEVVQHISKTPKLLDLITNYHGCENIIREALSNPGNQEIESNAFQEVSDVVDILYKFYAFSNNLETMWTNLLQSICTDDTMQSIGNQQALVKQIAEIFKFVFLFDAQKIIHPSIQNDFSYFRRVYHRMKQQIKKKKKKVDEEIANKMSFFFAYPTPLMKVLIDSTTKIKENEQLVTGLAFLADVCTKTLMETKEKDDDNLKDDIDNGDDHNCMLLLCTMAGCIILVDHLDNNGAFHSKSHIKIKAAVSTLVDYQNYVDVNFLINSLRFTTLHLNDEQTVTDVKRLLCPQ
jgi:hypothetical protein